MTKLILFALGCAVFVRDAGAIDNLNCESTLHAEYQIAPGTTIRLSRDEIVVRGRLETRLIKTSRIVQMHNILDVEGFDRIFARHDDASHRLRPGDRVYLINAAGRLFLHGRYGEVNKTVMLDYDGEFSEADIPQPQLFQDAERKVPRLADDRFSEMFEQRHEAVAVLRIDENERRRLQARLNPQIQRYEQHRHNPDRFVTITPHREPYELRVFETNLDGHLRHAYPNFPLLNKHGLYFLKLTLERGSRLIPIRSGDQLFVMDQHDEVLAEYEIEEYPIMVREPNKDERIAKLIQSYGYQARTVLIRKVGR